MIVIKTKPFRSISFQNIFERAFFWKNSDDTLINKLTNFCMFGPNYIEPEFKSFMTLDEFLELSPNKDNTRTKIQRVLDWYNNLNKNIDYVKIHGHDIWNLDNTLADIICPALIKLKSINEGYPLVDDEDVPESLQTKSDNSEDNYSIFKWHYVLDEMIYAFNTKILEDCVNYNEKEEVRAAIGFKLFGKYYQSLWT